MTKLKLFTKAKQYTQSSFPSKDYNGVQETYTNRDIKLRSAIQKAYNDTKAYATNPNVSGMHVAFTMIQATDKRRVLGVECTPRFALLRNILALLTQLGGKYQMVKHFTNPNTDRFIGVALCTYHIPAKYFDERGILKDNLLYTDIHNLIKK